MPNRWKMDARQEIDALNAEFAYCVDNGPSERIADLFTEQGTYAIRHGGQDRLSTGRDAIRAAYAARAARAPRTSCHLFTNLHVEFDSRDRAHGHGILLLFAHDGAPPHPATPMLVARYDDHYQWLEHEGWRYQARRATALFESASGPPIALDLGQSSQPAS